MVSGACATTYTWPGKLQSSLLGYFPGLYETVTGDTDAPSHHFLASQALSLQPSSGFCTGGLHR